MKEITKDMVIGDILDVEPGTAMFFFEMGMHCLGCPASRGETVELTCPNCKKKVNFGVFSNLERRFVPKVTLLDCNTVYFLVCPECASIYTVDVDNFSKIKLLSI